MLVIQKPRAREFAATLQDYIIDTDVSITFAVEYGGKRILDEEYVPDANNQVRIRQLGRFCAMALWGEWPGKAAMAQPHACGSFRFLFNNVLDTTSFVYLSRFITPKDAMKPGVFSLSSRRVIYRGTKSYATGLLAAGAVPSYTIAATTSTGNKVSAKVEVSGADGDIPCTVEIDVDAIEAAHKWKDIAELSVQFRDGTAHFSVYAAQLPHIWQFRFRNCFDLPETVCCTESLLLSGNNTSDNAVIYGEERKYDLKVTDEYTAKSGPIFLQSDYKIWHDFIHSPMVQVYNEGQWVPIVITKSKFERDFRRTQLKGVEFSFRPSRPDQNMLEV